MIDFKPSAGISIGVELELQFLDPVTFDLVDGILPLKDLCPENPHIIPEYEQTTVEINSRICGNIREMEQDILSLVSTIRRKCRDLGLVISGGGTHPFCSRFAKVTPTPRFLAMERIEGYLGHTSTTFALHVHVGMATGEDTIAVMKSLRPYLPVLIALSASSPFWWGHDTGYACYRQRVLAAMRSYGIPPLFESWKDFSDFFECASRAAAFNSLDDIHWDIRPRPDMGTLEIRVMDSQPTIREAVTLSSFVLVLVTHIRKTIAKGDDERALKPLSSWIEKENYFRATRDGIDTIYITDNRGNTSPLRAVIDDTIEAVAGTAEEMGEGEHLKQLQKILDNGPSYIRQRNIFKERESLKEVAASLVREFEEDLEL
jgi:carboxylate-amine ligase